MTREECNELRIRLGLNPVSLQFWYDHRNYVLPCCTYSYRIRDRKPKKEFFYADVTWMKATKEEYMEYYTFSRKMLDEYMQEEKKWKIMNICREKEDEV